MSNKTNEKNKHYFTTEEIRNDEYFKDWMLFLKPAANTEKAYLAALQRLTDFTQKPPTELIESAESELGKSMKRREIFKLIPRFHAHLEKEGLAPKSIKSIVWGAIASYYKHNYIDFPKPPKSMRGVKPREENMQRSDKEEIRNALKLASKRDRAIILSQVSSGLSASDISNLTDHQFINGYDPEIKVCTIHYVRQKTGVKAHTFLNPEACEAIFVYREARNALPAADKAWAEKRYEKRKTTPKGPLFIKEAISPKYLEKHDEKYRRLSSDKISNLYITIVKRAGIETDKGIMNTFRSHNMRKLFNSELKNNGMEYDDVEYMMGHTLDGVRSSYDDLDPEVLKERYMQRMHHLYIETERMEEIDVTTTPEYQAVVKEKEELQTQVTDVSKAVAFVREKAKEVKSMQNDIDVMINIFGKEKYEQLKMEVEMKKLQEMMMTEVEA